MKKSAEFSPEVRERAVRMVLEHRAEHPSQWAAIESIADKIGCVPQTLRGWVKQHEADAGQRDGVSIVEAQRVICGPDLTSRPGPTGFIGARSGQRLAHRNPDRPRRTAQPGMVPHAGRSQGAGRGLAPALQRAPAAQGLGLPAHPLRFAASGPTPITSPRDSPPEWLQVP